MEDFFAASHEKNIEPSGQRDRSCDPFRSILAASTHRSPEDLRDRHAHERGYNIGTVIGVMAEQNALIPLLSMHDAHGVHMRKQNDRGSILRHLGMEDVRMPEVLVKTLKSFRILVQQMPNVGSWIVLSGNRKVHRHSCLTLFAVKRGLNYLCRRR